MQSLNQEVDGRSFEEVFPEIKLIENLYPQGNRVLVQLKHVKTKSRGGLVLVEDTRQSERYNEQVAIVRKVGPLAYKNVEDLSDWQEGPWCAPGDLVRVAKYGGDRFSFAVGEGDNRDWAHFVIVQDREIVSKISDFETAKALVAFI